MLRACPAAAGDRLSPCTLLKSRGQALATLCMTEVVSHGVIHYAFPVLAAQIAAGTSWYGPRRVQALTILTLAASFASTIVLAAVTIPANALGVRLPWTQPPPGAAAAAPRPDHQVLASRPFLLLVTAAALRAFAQYSALVNLVPLLTDRGLSPGLAASALGPGGAGRSSAACSTLP